MQCQRPLVVIGLPQINSSTTDSSGAATARRKALERWTSTQSIWCHHPVQPLQAAACTQASGTIPQTGGFDAQPLPRRPEPVTPPRAAPTAESAGRHRQTTTSNTNCGVNTYTRRRRLAQSLA